jgi:ribosomal protein S18 acetylase RimI-like enzyme
VTSTRSFDATAADDNLVAHATNAAASLPGARVELASDLVLVDSGIPCDTFNLVCRSRLEGKTASARIAGAIAFFGRSGHSYSWWLTPGYSPPDLPERLQQAGLLPAESELAMVLDLASLAPVQSPAGLEIRRVTGSDELATFAALSAGNWSPPDQQVVRYYEQARPALLRADSAQWLYLGILDGTPVATAELTVGGGVVGLYNISTRREYRGRGIGSALTARPLADARTAGHRTAILQAAPDGVRIYRRLGFREFGTITEFKPAGGA